MLRLDNIRVRDKLVYIYLFGIFIPLIIINLLFFLSLRREIREKSQARHNYTANRIAESITEEFLNGIYFLEQFYRDKRIYDVLNTPYENSQQYVVAYYEFFSQPFIAYNPFYTNIHDITIYTTNSTVLDSEWILHTSADIVNQPWYQRAIACGKEEILVFGDRIETISGDVHHYVSLIKKLNYWGIPNLQNSIIKIDIKSDVFARILAKENAAELFLLDEGERLIASSNDSMSTTHYLEVMDLEGLREKGYVLRKPIHLRNTGSIWILAGSFQQNPFQITNRSMLPLFFTTLGIFLFSTFLIYRVSKSIYHRLNLLSHHMDRDQHQALDPETLPEAGKDEIGQVIQSYNFMIQRIKRLIKDIHQAHLEQKNMELERKQARLNALWSKVNPHYLFNVLETIRMKCLEKEERETAGIIKYMSKSYRQLINWDRDLIPLAGELEMLREFLHIQKYRFGDELHFTISVEDQLLNTLIPKMTLQPFVENACLHGTEAIEGRGEIRVTITKYDGKLSCLITDNGQGMSKEELEKVMTHCRASGVQKEMLGSGIRNVYQRLRSYYRDFRFDIQSAPGKGTRVTLVLPAASGGG